MWLWVLLLLPSVALQAQDRVVTGRISDEKGTLLEGVAVMEKGTSNGIMTDSNGQYSLTLTTSNPVIVISCLGYRSQEISVGRERVIDVALEEDISELDETVVVVVAYLGNLLVCVLHEGGLLLRDYHVAEVE